MSTEFTQLPTYVSECLIMVKIINLAEAIDISDDDDIPDSKFLSIKMLSQNTQQWVIQFLN